MDGKRGRVQYIEFYTDISLHVKTDALYFIQRRQKSKGSDILNFAKWRIACCVYTYTRSVSEERLYYKIYVYKFRTYINTLTTPTRVHNFSYLFLSLSPESVIFNSVQRAKIVREKLTFLLRGYIPG